VLTVRSYHVGVDSDESGTAGSCQRPPARCAAAIRFCQRPTWFVFLARSLVCLSFGFLTSGSLCDRDSGAKGEPILYHFGNISANDTSEVNMQRWLWLQNGTMIMP
jgi:hypothetical protein